MNKILCLSIALMFFVSVIPEETDAISKGQLFVAKYLIRKFIYSVRAPPENHLTLIPGLVRLVFHDCSGKNCDGCINRTHPFNGRVVPVVEKMETLYNATLYGGVSLQNWMSRADFWALSSVVATDLAVGINNYRCRKSRKPYCRTPRVKIPIVFGRQDCPTSPYYTSAITPALPSAFLNNTQVLDFFYEHFGFNPKETTIIMGGHSLGFTSDQTNIGGVWEKGNIDGFGNRYFKNIVNPGLNWTQVDTNGVSRFHWEGKCDAFGLDTDIVLVRDTSVNTVTGESNSYLGSPLSPTFKYALEFAVDPKSFAKNYGKTFFKMITLGLP